MPGSSASGPGAPTAGAIRSGPVAVFAADGAPPGNAAGAPLPVEAREEVLDEAHASIDATAAARTAMRTHARIVGRGPECVVRDPISPSPLATARAVSEYERRPDE